MTAPTIPRCPVCQKQRVLYAGTCGPCGDTEREADEMRETAREARKGYRRERDR
jgi:hypothetical protein